MAGRNPVDEAGFSRLSGEFGGNSGANSPPADGPRRARTHGRFGATQSARCLRVPALAATEHSAARNRAASPVIGSRFTPVHVFLPQSASNC